MTYTNERLQQSITFSRETNYFYSDGERMKEGDILIIQARVEDSENFFNMRIGVVCFFNQWRNHGIVICLDKPFRETIENYDNKTTIRFIKEGISEPGFDLCERASHVYKEFNAIVEEYQTIKNTMILARDNKRNEEYKKLSVWQKIRAQFN